MTTETRPTLAMTMGDPAGIGPEVTVRALSDKSVRSCARVVVIGDRKVLAEACRVTGVDVPWHIVTDRHDVVSADDSDDRVSLFDMGNVAPAHGSGASYLQNTVRHPWTTLTRRWNLWMTGRSQGS